MLDLALIAVGLASLAVVTVFSIMRFKDAAPLQRFAIVLFPLSQVVTAAFLFVVIEKSEFGTAAALAICTVCIACSAATIALLKAVRSSLTRQLDEERAELLAAQVKTQEDYAARLKEEAQQAAIARTALADALVHVRESLASGSAEKMAQRLEQAEAVLQAPGRVLCANRVIDVLMREKSSACEKAGITLKCTLDVRADLPFSPVDLCAVFANVMDNAIAAASACTPGERRIEVRAVEAVGLFVVDVVNSCVEDGDSGAANAQRPARGLAEHGWGLAILDDIASRYDGTVEHERAANSYRTTVSLVVPAEEDAI